MSLDFKDIQKVVQKTDSTIQDVSKYIKVYESNKSLIDSILGLILGLFKKKKNPVVPPPVTNPGAPTMPDTNTGQVYHRLVLKCFFLEGDRKGGGGGPIYSKNHFDQVLSAGGPAAQMVNERMHFDLTPYDAKGNEIGPDDSRHPVVPGDVPVRGVWTYDGEVMTDSGNDKFNWESVKDDHGCTPVLCLESGSNGRKKASLKMFILPEFNGGVRVDSNEVFWYCD